MLSIDKTLDAARESWVQSANKSETDFPIQNLPLGIFSVNSDDRRPCAAIGESIVDLQALGRAGLLPDDLVPLLNSGDLDLLFGEGVKVIGRLRSVLGDLLDAAAAGKIREIVSAQALRPMAEIRLHLPSSVRSYTDFYCGIYHAEEVGRLVGNDPILPPSYHAMPIGYNGRATSVRPSGEGVVRPSGQRLVDGKPAFGPSQHLDFELELGAFVAGDNQLGEPVHIGDAAARIAGFCLLNDWSSRDLQFWEMTPLGPFNGKGFSTTVSPWVVTPHAMVPFRSRVMDRAPEHANILPYLIDKDDQRAGGLDIQLTVLLRTQAMREAGTAPIEILKSNGQHLYWTFAQMVVQHGCAGVSLRAGDLIGSGTVSGPSRGMYGSLLELCKLGESPLKLPSGDERAWLEDGDEVIFSARCERDGFRSIGFGSCAGRIEPANH